MVKTRRKQEGAIDARGNKEELEQGLLTAMRFTNRSSSCVFLNPDVLAALKKEKFLQCFEKGTFWTQCSLIFATCVKKLKKSKKKDRVSPCLGAV